MLISSLRSRKLIVPNNLILALSRNLRTINIPKNGIFSPHVLLNESAGFNVLANTLKILQKVNISGDINSCNQDEAVDEDERLFQPVIRTLVDKQYHENLTLYNSRLYYVTKSKEDLKNAQKQMEPVLFEIKGLKEPSSGLTKAIVEAIRKGGNNKKSDTGPGL
jgi:hypothetical protein